MKRLKRLAAMLLILCLLASMLPTVTFAASTASGTCGDNLTWILDNEGTLTISGTGTMYNWDFFNNAPWYGKRLFVEMIIVEDGVTSIGSFAFQDCSSLQSITLPDSVTEVDVYAFLNCDSLTDVYINDITKWCSIRFSPLDGNPLGYAENLYENEFLITDLVIPDSINTIGAFVFDDYKSLTSITISDSVTTIEDGAFSGCTGLESITIPDSVTSIGNYAFRDCSSLTSVIIGNGVTSIGNSAFDNCTSLSSMNMGAGVTSIGESAFRGCTSLTDVYYNGTNGNWKTIYIGTDNNALISANIAYLKGLGDYCGENVFWALDEKGLLNISGTGNMDNCTFYNSPWYAERSSVKEVVIEEGVTSIGEYAFYDCTRLASVTIPESVISVGENAFRYCERLSGIWVDENNPAYCSDSQSVLFNKDKTVLLQAPGRLSGSYTIPGTVTEIADSAFMLCENLAEIVIPGSVTTIGTEAFYDCLTLTDVTYNGTQAQWAQISISEDNEALTDANIKFLGDAVTEDFAAAVLDENGNVAGKYSSFSEAIAAAESGDTVVLQKAASEEKLILWGGVTLDLNGYTLTVDSVLCFKTANIVDSSELSAGLLKINDYDGNMIGENNAQLPVYDPQLGGYRFFAVTVISHAVTGKESATPKYWFTIDIGNFDQLYALYQADGQLQIQAKLTWTQQGGDMVCATYATADMQFTSRWVEEYHNGNQLYIAVSVENSANLDGFALTPCVTSGDFEISGEEM